MATTLALDAAPPAADALKLPGDATTTTTVTTAAITTTTTTTLSSKQQQPETEEDTAAAAAAAAGPSELLLESDSNTPHTKQEESDWRASSADDAASPARFSLIDFPAKVRASLFARKPRKLKRRKPVRAAGGGGGGDTSSQSSGSKARAASASPSPSPAALAKLKNAQLPAVATPESAPADKSVETFKHFWDEKLRHTMEKLASLSKAEAERPSGDVFHLLLKLYAHQDIVEELYSSCEANAPEFEFYIPQLCTFLLHGNYAKQHQLECFLMSRSGESLPFAHRLTWFLRSFCDDAKRYKSEYLSVTASPDEENSDLLTAIEHRAGVPALLMNNGLCNEEVSVAKPSNLLRRRSSVFAIDEEMDPRVLATDESFAGHLQTKQQLVVYKARPQEGDSHQASLYKQTPDFVSALTGLADRLIAVPLPQRVPELRAGLSAIQDQVLPSDVLYLPIGNTHHRVKAIHVDECFTFSTKERVPYFLVVEVLEYSVVPAAASPSSLKRRQKAGDATKSPTAASTAAAAATGAHRPPSRGFSLMLPFKKNGHAIEPSFAPHRRVRGGHTSDSSVSESTPSRLSRLSERMSERMTDCTDSSSALSLLEGAEQPEEAADDSKESPAAAEPPTTTAAASTDAAATETAAALATKASAKPTKEGESAAAAAATTPGVTSFFGYLLGSSKKQPAPPKTQKAGLKDMQKAGAVPLTPKYPLDGEDGDDEKEEEEENLVEPPVAAAVAVATCVAPAEETTADKEEQEEVEKQANELLEKANEEQKMRMGQWSLPRAGRRKSRSSASARGGQFDTFYSSWFAKKQKHEKDEVCTHPETALSGASAPTAAPADVVVAVASEPAPTAQVPTLETLSEHASSLTSPAAPVAAPPTAKPAVSKKQQRVLSAAAAKKRAADNDTSQEEGGGGGRRKRDRDLSMSLDFTDSNAWKVKFDLEDGLTDNEREGSDSEPEEKDASAAAAAKDDDEEETPIIVFRERWSEKEARIRRTSEFRDHPGWRLLSVIVKSNDDLRQEQFAAQLIAQCDRIFKEYSLPLRLRPYNVIATSAKTGLIEAVPDTVSLDSLKRNDPDYTTLLDFYCRLHGDTESVGFARARRNFVESLAAYSMVCYVFQIKDRHNGNILLDTQGHVIHIDFGFLLTNSPGSNLNFEKAPFKLTDEFVELMGGPRSSTFRYFRSLCIRAFLALQRNMDKIVLLVEMMLVGNADLPCFAGGKRAVIEGLRARLKPGERTSACQLFVNQLIDQSINNWRTRWYDKYQRACLGIL